MKNNNMESNKMESNKMESNNMENQINKMKRINHKINNITTQRSNDGPG